MKFNKKFEISPEFESLFALNTKEEELEHEAKMIMFRFISEIQKLNFEKPIKKKELAKAIGTSASYITQLYQGDKLINLLTLAKFQKFYDVTFEVKAKSNSENYSSEVGKSFDPSKLKNRMNDENGLWVFINKNPDYNQSKLGQTKRHSSLKVA